MGLWFKLKCTPILTELFVQTVSLAAYGCQKAIREGKDNIFALTYASLAIVGIGSICFHATLKYPMQLGMICV